MNGGHRLALVGFVLALLIVFHLDQSAYFHPRFYLFLARFPAYRASAARLFVLIAYAWRAIHLSILKTDARNSDAQAGPLLQNKVPPVFNLIGSISTNMTKYPEYPIATWVFGVKN